MRHLVRFLQNAIYVLEFQLGLLKINRAANRPEDRSPRRGAVDTLSAWTLNEDARLDIIISTIGVTGRMPEWTDRFRLGTVLCGYDTDDAGDCAAGILEARNPSVRRMRPDGGKDWNEILQGRVRARS